MERYEMAEILRQKANVTYDQARKALEESNWDMLQAMVILEKEGKLNQGAAPKASKTTQTQPKAEGIISKVIGWVTDLIDKGNQHRFIIKKDDQQVGSMTVTVFAALLLFLHGLSLFLLVLGLVFGYRYHFVSAAQVKDAKNAAKEAENAADELQNWHTVNSMNI
jgi:hypothetical protein